MFYNKFISSGLNKTKYGIKTVLYFLGDINATPN